ncbi:salicylate hydroxylase [Penicillium frequentans]|uniref:Salicylate hydroxylase n=1 Tax=Penicillium frequentans TaxID=3151616 RepID=A0AAD6GL12_9EURO|nr:salicylate hydroxylase [Penicillium glabrum]
MANIYQADSTMIRNHAGAQTTVIIVGAGFAGITAAIECRLNGMRSVLIEKYKDSFEYGDLIDFYPNAGIIIERWANGNVAKKLLDICVRNAQCWDYLTHKDELIYSDPYLITAGDYTKQFAGHRGQMHKIFLDYAEEVGVEFKFGCEVIDYLETENTAGVELRSGEKIFGDCVLASDGPRSIARQKVLHLEDKKVNSGYAIYRAFFEINDEHRLDPRIKDFCRKDVDTLKIWLGPDAHTLAYSWNEGKDLVWVGTHKDMTDIKESWSFPGDKQEALQEFTGFPEQFKALVEHTPPKKLTDYKLVWRDALATWLSKGKRIALIGDAAHCHLPTSAQGGSQAMEDATTTAICIRNAKGDIPLALQVMERIRFNRSHVIHQSGIDMRDDWHKCDFEKYADHPDSIAQMRTPWIIMFDPQVNAEKHYTALAKDVLKGRKGTIQELSIPADGNFDHLKPGNPWKPFDWTVKEHKCEWCTRTNAAGRSRQSSL